MKWRLRRFLFPKTPFPRRSRRRKGGVPRKARHFSESGIFDKISSSRVINILHYLTFGNFTDFFVGGAERRPVRFEREIVSARRASRLAKKRFLSFAIF